MSERKTVVQFGINHILQLSGKPDVLFWTCSLSIDADGAPNAYHPKGSPPGLDHLANAGKPGNWWGLACNADGVPYIQGPNDPCPEFYVSTTALFDGRKNPRDQRAYVNSLAVPYIVLPSKPKFAGNQRLGDLALVFNNKSGLCSWAIYADIGPANKVGEGSIRLADEIGINSNPKTGGTASEIIAMIYFAGSNLGWPLPTEAAFERAAWLLFEQWGGKASAKLALPQINWDQFTMPIFTGPQPQEPEPPQAETPIVTISVTVPKGVIVNVIQNPSPVEA